MLIILYQQKIKMILNKFLKLLKIYNQIQIMHKNKLMINIMNFKIYINKKKKKLKINYLNYNLCINHKNFNQKIHLLQKH